MRVITEIETRICYWQETHILEAFCEPFDGIIRCTEGVQPPEIHFLNTFISIVFPHPIIIDRQRDAVIHQEVLFIYPTPKD